MTTTSKQDVPEAWDDHMVDSDMDYAVAAAPEHEEALDEALGMQSISIRLPRQLIEHYKLIAHVHKVGYQPLMRDVMARWVPNALKEIFDMEQAKAAKASTNATLAEVSVAEPCDDEPMRKAA